MEMSVNAIMRECLVVVGNGGKWEAVQVVLLPTFP